MSIVRFASDVQAFHDKFGLATPTNFTRLSDELHKFRSGFFTEELTEYTDAVNALDLSTALDSLIDLIYIISGAALLHGLTPLELNSGTALAANMFDGAFVLPIDPESLPEGTAQLPAAEPAAAFAKTMQFHIAAYDELHEDETVDDTTRKLYVTGILGAMTACCFSASAYSAVTEELWDELWDDVQRANMSKERALKASDSKRGSTFDVIKPAGWVSPRTDEIIAKHAA
jgi:predicted HAD superfamily Cof-like phosphohydrolase